MSLSQELLPTHLLERSQEASGVGLRCGLILRDLYEAASQEINFGEIERRLAAEPGPEQGIAALYYSGLQVWKVASERFLGGVDDYFTPAQHQWIAGHTFAVDAPQMVSGFMQSAFTAPAIFACWYADAAGLSDSSAPMRKMYGNISTETVDGVINADWFHQMLRRGSRTATGLYRNSMGYDQRIQAFMARSVKGTQKRYYAAMPDGQAPVELDIADEENQNPVPAHLSADFSSFLKDRLKVHNTRVRLTPTEVKPYNGVSRGCPVSHEQFRAAQSDVADPELTTIASVISVGEAGTATVKWNMDPYKFTCQALSNILRQL